MYIKKTTSQQKGKLLAIVLILVLMLFASLSERVYGISAVVQSYEESLYIEMKDHRIFELVRCKIHISIETEPDGTWRNNSRYWGYIKIVLDWYNTSLCPHGISLLIHAPFMAYPSPYVNQSIDGEYVPPHEINKTLIGVWGFTRFTFSFKTESCLKESVWVRPSMLYTVYNATSPFTDEYRICSSYWELPDFWITIMADPQQRLQTEMVARMETLEKRLEFLSNLLNHIITLFVISIGIYVATSVYLATRKPKAKTELKTT
jgi:hypothetical protein